MQSVRPCVYVEGSAWACRHARMRACVRTPARLCVRACVHACPTWKVMLDAPAACSAGTYLAGSYRREKTHKQWTAQATLSCLNSSEVRTINASSTGSTGCGARQTALQASTFTLQITCP